MKGIKILLFAILCMASMQSCKKKDDAPAAALIVRSFSPSTAFAGTTLQVMIDDLPSDANAIIVKVGSSTGVKPDAVTNAGLTVTVPNDATTGKIQVIANGKTYMSQDVFTVPEQTAVSITDFTPKLARPNSTITITGKGFGDDPSLVRIAIGSYGPYKPVSISPTSIVIQTDTYTTSGKVIITRGKSTGVSADNFKALPLPPPYLPLKIVSYTTHAKVGEAVTIYGSGFGNVKEYITISFGGAPGVHPDDLSTTGLTMQVYNLPANAKSGKITVTVEGKSVTGTDDFTVDK